MKQPPKKLKTNEAPLSEDEISRILQQKEGGGHTSSQITEQNEGQNSTETKRNPSYESVRTRLENALQKDNLLEALGHTSVAKKLNDGR